jgi:hypothetical protein
MFPQMDAEISSDRMAMAREQRPEKHFKRLETD